MEKYFAIVFLGLLLGSIGCTKEDDLIIERKQWLLANKKRKITGISMKPAAVDFTNVYDSLPSFR